ncbi:MAG: hypothetical protein K9H25_10160 [Rhodospirillum sp.]|nr:hypothetical protein [Rhodospirillum sp.]MCF8490321.1 hypothetical protein [Rhodospirillum sp.]MCF8500161.1 hypothetical protein [Rhodospirillum sp.]
MDGNPTPPEPRGARTMVQVVYALYALSVFIGITGVVGVIIAHIKRDDYVGTIYADHMTWQIRTFWFCLILGVIGMVTMTFGIGFLILGVSALWFIYRIVKGFLAVNDRKGFPDPKSLI